MTAGCSSKHKNTGHTQKGHTQRRGGGGRKGDRRNACQRACACAWGGQSHLEASAHNILGSLHVSLCIASSDNAFLHPKCEHTRYKTHKVVHLSFDMSVGHIGNEDV